MRCDVVVGGEEAPLLPAPPRRRGGPPVGAVAAVAGMCGAAIGYACGRGGPLPADGGYGRHHQSAVTPLTPRDMWASDFHRLHASFLSTARYVDLTHAFHPNPFPMWELFAPAKVGAGKSSGDNSAYPTVHAGDDWASAACATTAYHLPTDQIGTQLDPPAHWDERGATISDQRRTQQGSPNAVADLPPTLRLPRPWPDHSSTSAREAKYVLLRATFSDTSTTTSGSTDRARPRDTPTRHDACAQRAVACVTQRGHRCGWSGVSTLATPSQCARVVGTVLGGADVCARGSVGPGDGEAGTASLFEWGARCDHSLCDTAGAAAVPCACAATGPARRAGAAPPRRCHTAARRARDALMHGADDPAGGG
eukprot:gene22852-52284_t